MEIASRYSLTFLLNSLWQIPLAAGVAWLACRFMRRAPAAHRHAVWVAALAVSILLPLAGLRPIASSVSMTFDPAVLGLDANGAAFSGPAARPASAPRAATSTPPERTVSFPETTATVLIGAYLLFLLVGLARLLRSLKRTVTLQQPVTEAGAPERIQRILDRCQTALGVRGARVIFSDRVMAPANAGRTILLPEALREETSDEVLTAAIGHEIAHIARRDFACNIGYELFGLPVAFHPAAWLIRREIARSREMACDELVAARVMDATPYARSILHIAAQAIAPPRAAYALSALDGGDLEGRIRRLTSPRSFAKRPLLLLGAGLAALGICAVLASSAALVARAQDSTDAVASKVSAAKNLLRPFQPGQIPTDVAAQARQLYTDALSLDPKSQPALHGMLYLLVNTRQFADAHDFALKAINANASDTEAYYTAGFLDWSLTYPDYAAARKQTNMQPMDQGPIPDNGLRQSLREKHGAQVEEGFRMLQVALQLEPGYSDAMAYMNLLDRIEAGIADTTEQAADYTAKANDWVTRALAARRNAQNAPKPDADGFTAPPPPPPPPPPPGHSNSAPPAQGAIYVGPWVQAAKLVSQQQPIYPAEARAAGIEGSVLLNVTIAKDGSVSDVQIAQGNSVLAQAAMKAVMNWKYEPTLLNGEPAQVATQVKVNFSLGN